MTVGLLSFAALLAGFNGGRSQVNLNFLQTGGDYPFLNAMKTAQAWSFVNNANAPVTPDLLDSNGYPTTIINSGVKTVFYVPTQAARPGNYVITWTGNGTIILGMQNTLAGGSLTGSGGSGRYVFSTTDNQFSVGISALPVTNLQVFHASDEASLLAGNAFSDNATRSFKQRLKEANFGVLRFLNWQSGNTTNVTTWSTRKPTGYVFYSGHEVRQSLYAGTTTNVGNAYSTSIFPPIHSSTGAAWTSGGPLDKDTIHILFNASATQSGTCSLNVNGAGALNILDAYSGALSVGGNSYPIGGTYQSLATLVYDADLNAWIKQGGDAGENSKGIDNCVPPELMVQLCKEVGAHPHFVSPPLACTPMTNWHTQLATYCQSYAASNAPWMIPRFEGPNELWNTAGGFYQTTYANAKATAYGWGADFYNWYGRAISTIGQAVSTVYGNDRTKYQVLCGVQTGTGDTLGNRNNSNPRLASTKYLAQTPQSPYTATAASGWVTHVCCAQYFGPSDLGTGTETTLAANFAGKAFVASIASGVMTVTALNASNSAALAVGDTIFGTEIFAVGGGIPAGVTITSFGTGAGGTGTYNLSNGSLTVASQNMTGATDLTAPVTYADTSNSGSVPYTVAYCLTLYTGWKSWAQGFGIQKMCGYEGGYSPDYSNNQGNSLVDMLKSASKLDTNLSSFTMTNYGNFVGLTGGGFVAEFPSCFQLSGNPNLFGYSTDAWSVLEDIYQANPPQWTAIVAFNH